MAVHMPRTKCLSQSMMRHGKDQVEQHKCTLAMHPLVGSAVGIIP